MGEGHSNGIIERVVGLVTGQARTLKAALEHRIGTRVPPDARILCWMVEFAAYLMNRCERRCRGCMGERTTHRSWHSERRFCTCSPGQHEEESGNRDSILECLLACLNSSSKAVVVTEQGLAIKARAANVRRIPESERWDADRTLGMRAVPWSPDGSDNAFDIQVGMERPAEMVPRAPGEVLMENQVAEQTSNDGASAKVALGAGT